VPWPFEVEVLLELPVDEVARRLPAALAELSASGDGTLLRMRVSSLDWTARTLAGLGCPFEVRRPEALRESVRVLARRLAAWA
jgi:predicted DNA-binding transcriptional regulator YafY